MESSLITKNQKLEASNTLRKALIFPATNFNFFIFTILTSLPLFCFMFYYEPFLQKLLAETFKILNPSLQNQIYYNRNWSTPIDIATQLNKQFPNELTFLFFLYLLPLHLLKLTATVVTVDVASKIYTEETPRMSLKEMVHIPFDKTRLKNLKGNFVTYVYVVVLSTCTLLGLTWLGTTYFVVSRFGDMSYGGSFFSLLCWPAFVGLLAMYFSWSVVWNLSVVISVSDGAHGIKAFAKAIYFSCGCEWRGFILVLVFFAWELGLRLSCLYLGCCERGNCIFLVALVMLLCIGNVVKWVASTIYFLDCKNRALEKKLLMDSRKRGETLSKQLAQSHKVSILRF